MIHHQYYDENNHHPHVVQNYNFIPPYPNEPYPITTNDGQHPESFQALHSNDLYEFLPEEIFQLDQPIVKNESQSSTYANAVNSIDQLAMPYANTGSIMTPSSQSYIDLSSGQIETNMKYPPLHNQFPPSEINNNSNFTSEAPSTNVIDHTQFQLNQEASRVNCISENDKKHKFDENQSLKSQFHQSYHQAASLFSKRDSNCAIQQSSYYSSTDSSYPVHFATKTMNDVNRAMEKYHFHITNN